jgi:hypothetical protein
MAGKSTFVRILQRIVGIENTYQLRTEHLHEKIRDVSYRGKTLLIGPDVAGDFLMCKGASMLKVLVGGDPISGEVRATEPETSRCSALSNIVMTCNSRLRIRLEEDPGGVAAPHAHHPLRESSSEKRILDFTRCYSGRKGAEYFGGPCWFRETAGRVRGARRLRVERHAAGPD